MIETLLEHGIVGSQSVDLVAAVLRLFAVGLLPFAAYQLLMRAFYTRQDARTPALSNVVENGATIGLDLALFGALSVKGLALAHSLGYFVGCAVAGWILVRRVGPGGRPGVAARDGQGRDRLRGRRRGDAGRSSRACEGLIGPGDWRALVQLVARCGGGCGRVPRASHALLRVRDLAVLRRLVPGQ